MYTILDIIFILALCWYIAKKHLLKPSLLWFYFFAPTCTIFYSKINYKYILYYLNFYSRARLCYDYISVQYFITQNDKYYIMTVKYRRPYNNIAVYTITVKLKSIIHSPWVM